MKGTIESELDRLIDNGHRLQHAMCLACFGQAYEEQLENAVGPRNKDQMIQGLPDFKQDYQAWYSESLALIKQVLPDHVADFVAYYECTRPRTEYSTETYLIRDYLQGIVIRRPNGKVRIDGRAACPKFVQQVSIVRAAKRTLDSVLVRLTSIVQAEIFDSELESAKALASGGFLRASGAICGVVIEKHLKQMCVDHCIGVRGDAGIANLNDALKNSGTIDIPQWRFVQSMADIRNLCDHAKGREPSMEEIERLLSGTNEIVKTIS